MEVPPLDNNIRNILQEIDYYALNQTQTLVSYRFIQQGVRGTQLYFFLLKL
jgi:hypothetical protein